jgi:hypothetical protein
VDLLCARSALGIAQPRGNAATGVPTGSQSGGSGSTAAGNGNVLVIACRRASDGSVTSDCSYTARPRTGTTSKPAVGSYDPEQACTWKEAGENAAGGFEVYECR